jgi:hypothetical protein
LAVAISLATIHPKYLVTYGYSKRHKTETIKGQLKADFGVTPAPYSTGIFWRAKTKFKSDMLVMRSEAGRPPILVWTVQFCTFSTNSSVVVCVDYL